MKNTLLLILDGLGIAEKGKSNAIYLANAPILHKILAMPEVVELEASGRAVGLPTGFIGNSEVGHLNIGAGKVVYQDMTKIDLAIEDKSFYTNPVIIDVLEKAKKAGGRVHFMGLLSDAGVHSHIEHLKAFIHCADDFGLVSFTHAFLDGRDTPPQSAIKYVNMLEDFLATKKNAKLATMCGRFYAMDRDKRWERVEKAYNMLVLGEGINANNPVLAIENSYKEEIFDEFIKPHIINKDGIIKDNDAIIFFNFRADRAKELALAFTDTNFTEFERKKVKFSAILGMTMYDTKLELQVAFPKDNLKNTLGEQISKLGLKQLRLAETEKYAHVTYFFNGGREEAFDNEERILVPSPKEVQTYDQKPEMALFEVCEKLIENLQDKKHDFIVCNMANPDMIGHTGVISAAIKALEYVDNCLAKILEFKDWRIIITSDHGNIEQMLDERNNPHTAHTLNKVPLILFENGQAVSISKSEYTKLADIAKLILN